MRDIRNKQEYKAISERIEELLKTVGNETSTKDKDFIELDILSDLVVDYEEVRMSKLDSQNFSDISHSQQPHS